MSSFDTNNDPEITTIKIELEKVTNEVAALATDCKNDSNQVNVTVTSLDTMSLNSSNMESNIAEAGEQGRDETTKNVDKSRPPDFYDINEFLIEKLLDPVAPTIEVPVNPVLPTPQSGVTMDVTGDPNEFPFPIIKPPTYKDIKYGKVELYGQDTGPKIYNVKGNILSRPIITKNLPEAFRALPVHGKAESKAALKDFFEQKIRDYVGYGISDQEFGKLHEFMHGDDLRTGLEFSTPYCFPSQGPLSVDLKSTPLENGPGKNLCIVKKLLLRKRKDVQNHYPRKLKYRGLRMLPLSLGDEDHIKEMPEMNPGLDDGDDGPLEPGRDLIFRVRIYRPHSYGSKDQRDCKPTRHSVFNNDMVILGRQRLTAFRDRIACANDVGLRIDVSNNPDCFNTESAKHLFPSGFLFINNVFYVDKRPGCVDHSAGIREWAERRRLGVFPVRDMAAVRLDDLVLRLGHPEVYMHQGKCEHLFTFSEVRLLGPTDPMRTSHYPCFTHISQNQSVYCTTCAEFGAKWIVVGCSRVPFDPAFFCETCFRLYLYDRNGKKIGNFKAYSYKGNAVNFLKPVTGLPVTDEGQSDNDEKSD